MAQGDVTIDLRGDNSNLKQNLGESKGVITSFASSATAALGIVGSALALAGAAAGIISLRDLYDEQADAEANLARTLETTGNAAGATIDQLKAYAKELQGVTNFSDQTILSGMRMAATFENVKGDEFKRVTELALDMAEATGGDAAGAMEGLARSLNDPLRGMMRLRAEGVLLTKAQQDQVKAMVEAGDIAGAQGVLLDELGKKYGGIARNAADPWDQFWNKITDLGESSFAIIAPIFDAFMGLLRDLTATAETIAPPLQAGVEELVALAQETFVAWQPVFEWFQELVTKRFVAVQMTLETLGQVFVDTWAMIAAAVDIDGAGVLKFFQDFFDFVNDLFIAGLIAMQVAVENWRDVVTVAVTGAWLGWLNNFENLKHLLTTTVPEALDWFSEHWHEVLEDMVVFAGTIFNNLIHNAEQFVGALAAALQGQDFELDLRGATEGFNSAIAENLPEFTKRQLTDTERALIQQLEEASGRIKATWDRKYDELDKRTKDFLEAGEETKKKADEIDPWGEGTDYTKPGTKGGDKKGGGGGSGFEDITALYDRIAGAAAKTPEIEVTVEMDAVEDGMFELASATAAQTTVLGEMRDLTRKIADKPTGLMA